jgi:uncharacterized coiled-coil protein SlyX
MYNPGINLFVGQKWRTRGGGTAEIIRILGAPLRHPFPVVAMHSDYEQRAHTLDGRSMVDTDADLIEMIELDAEGIHAARLKKLEAEIALKNIELSGAQSMLADLQTECIAKSREIDMLRDKVEGLEADLDSAVEVAFRRGAYEWARLNYPDAYVRLSSKEPSSEFASIIEAHKETIMRRIDDIMAPFFCAGLRATVTLAEGSDTAGSSALSLETGPVVSGYEPLAGVLREALDQAQAGKGKERHANGKHFLEQPIMAIGRMVGVGYQTGQSMKKQQEAVGMLARGEPDRAIAELLGAINYAAAAILAIQEQRHG